MNMMAYSKRDDNTFMCCFHPKEVGAGVCAFCLNERLTVLGSKQEKSNYKKIITKRSDDHQFLTEKKKMMRNDGAEHDSRIHYHLPKMFDLSSLLNRLAPKVDASSTCSYEDSFISIKFENDGVGSWEKGGKARTMSSHCDNMCRSRGSSKVQCKGGAKLVIEHAKPRQRRSWQKRIGHIFQLIKLKKSTKVNVCHVGTTTKLGVKVRYGHGRIRTLTKRKT